MSGDLIFEEPPGRTGGGVAGSSPFGQWLASLRSHPSEWAKWPEPKSWSAAGSAASKASRGVAYGVKPGEFEVVSRTVDGQTFIFARYVGAKS